CSCPGYTSGSASQQSALSAGERLVHPPINPAPQVPARTDGFSHRCTPTASPAAKPSPSQSGYQTGAASSIRPSQLLSLPSHSSPAPVNTSGSSSSQSVPHFPSVL